MQVLVAVPIFPLKCFRFKVDKNQPLWLVNSTVTQLSQIPLMIPKIE